MGKLSLVARSDVRRRVYFIGIAGPSGVGKSTLATRVAREFGSPVKPIGMDWYLDPKLMPRDRRWGKNWETPDGLDCARMLAELRELEQVLSGPLPKEHRMSSEDYDVLVEGLEPPGPEVVVVVEGFLLFYYQELYDFLHAHIWIDGDCETCLFRRHKRGKLKNRKKATDVEQMGPWFRDLVWKEYQQHRARQLRNAETALRVDGLLPAAEVAAMAMEHIMERLGLVPRKRKLERADSRERSTKARLTKRASSSRSPSWGALGSRPRSPPRSPPQSPPRSPPRSPLRARHASPRSPRRSARSPPPSLCASGRCDSPPSRGCEGFCRRCWARLGSGSRAEAERPRRNSRGCSRDKGQRRALRRR